MGILTTLANESVLLGSLVSALCVALDLPEIWMNVALAAVPLALAILIRQVVSTPKTVVSSLIDATTNVAAELGTTTVGAVGTLTERGETVANEVTKDVLGQVGGLVNKLGRKVLNA